ncbi:MULTISPECIES: glycosyltransferase family 2 protein [Kocuria]|uniref:glycosyltransferase family 2 protein n=1 Tax=Kocuria TaxID=57493 RepID=UPI0028E6D026|nr:glycosyltransferase family 2 protein [Kocuria carniphila]
MCRNEADIVGHTIRHLLAQGIDGIIVVDNLSVDGTRETLTKLADDDPRIFVGTDSLDAYHQGRKMSYLAHLARKAGADWVIPFDADEFWFARESSVADYLRSLEGVPVAKAELTDLHPLTVTGIDLENSNEQVQIEDNANSKKVALRPHRWVWIDNGNHTALDLGREVPSDLRIAHLPSRSIQQMERKARVGAAAIAKVEDAPANFGHHWKTTAALDRELLYRQWSERIATSRGDLARIPTVWKTWTDRGQ